MPAMPRKKLPTTGDARQSRRDDPPYMDWRAGRPAWIPGPALRRAGWALIPLKDEAGAYLPRGLARILAREINSDVDRWRADPAAPGLRHGPARAPAVIASPGGDDRNLANAFARMMDHASIRQLAPKSRAGYRWDLARFIAWAGSEHPATIDRATLAAWIEAEWDRVYAVNALGWSEAQWAAAPRQRAADGAAFIADVRAARWEAFDGARHKANIAGQAQMKGYIAAISRLYTFIARELKWIDPACNPASKFAIRSLKPRLRLPSDAELAHLVATADRIGLHAVGDALVILANLCPRPSDMVAWPLATLKRGYVAATLQKTGARVEFKLPRAVRRRGAAILWRYRARQPAAGAGQGGRAMPSLILTTDATGAPFTVDHLSGLFAQVRAAALPAMPSVADLTPYDFRKQGITRLDAAGNSRDAIAAISGHSYKTVCDILDHYIVPSREAADKAIDRHDAYQQERGVKW